MQIEKRRIDELMYECNVGLNHKKFHLEIQSKFERVFDFLTPRCWKYVSLIFENSHSISSHENH